MFRTMLKSKIHGATVTQRELHYTGSITLPIEIAKAADLLDGERVDVVNLNNGARITTYVILGDPGDSGICLNGPAARTAEVGDVIHVIGYGIFTDEEAKTLTPAIAHVTQENHLVKA